MKFRSDCRSTASSRAFDRSLPKHGQELDVVVGFPFDLICRAGPKRWNAIDHERFDVFSKRVDVAALHLERSLFAVIGHVSVEITVPRLHDQQHRASHRADEVGVTARASIQVARSSTHSFFQSKLPRTRSVATDLRRLEPLL